MTHIINVLEKPTTDNSIIRKDYQSYSPYLRSYENNDEKKNQDLYVLPSESFLHIQGHITKLDDSLVTTIAVLNDCMAYLFYEIRYKLNGIEIEHDICVLQAI